MLPKCVMYTFANGKVNQMVNNLKFHKNVIMLKHQNFSLIQYVAFSTYFQFELRVRIAYNFFHLFLF
jgi:hypothetical protein